MTKYTNVLQYVRGLMKNAINAGTGAILTTFGSNGAEALAPDALAGIGLNAKQAVAVFVVSALYAAIKYVHFSTEENPTQRSP